MHQPPSLTPPGIGVLKSDGGLRLDDMQVMPLKDGQVRVGARNWGSDARFGVGSGAAHLHGGGGQWDDLQVMKAPRSTSQNTCQRWARDFESTMDRAACPGQADIRTWHTCIRDAIARSLQPIAITHASHKPQSHASC